MMKNSIILPKTFEDKFKTRPECKGKPKLSYSQYNSYISEEYRNDYYIQYFLNIKLPSGDFAEFGSSVGEYIEHKAKGETVKGHLSDEDVEILDKIIDYPINCVYEDEIVIDFGSFVMEGYSDRTEYKNDNKVVIRDYKTLNIDTKSDFYASEDYGQTTLYCFQKEKEGFEIEGSEVLGIGRKGSKLGGTGGYKMRLSGEYKLIPTPYSKERAERLTAKIQGVTEEISEKYQKFLKYFK